MDEARLREFTAYEPDVCANFVADLWERAGYDCALVDPGTDGVATGLARHENGENLRLVTSPTRRASDIADPDTTSRPEADGAAEPTDNGDRTALARGRGFSPPSLAPSLSSLGWQPSEHTAAIDPRGNCWAGVGGTGRSSPGRSAGSSRSSDG